MRFRTDRPPLPALLAILVFAGVPAAGLAQGVEPAGTPFGEQVEVEVVNVDVVVTDRDGNRVTGLEREDFALFVDGQPVSIEYFYGPPVAAARMAMPAPASAHAPTPGAAPEMAPALTVVFVDQSALERRVRRDTLAELRQFAVTRQPDERVMVAGFEDALRLFAVPTAEGAAIETAFQSLAELPSRGSLVTTERNRLEHEIRAFGRVGPLVRSAEQPESNVQAIQRRQASETERLQSEIENWAERELDRQRRSLSALSDIVASLAAVPGRKSALLATAGFDAEPARFLLRFLAQKTSYDASVSSIPRVAELEQLAGQLNRDYEDLVHAAQNARVAFYTVVAREPPPSHNAAEFASAGRDQEKAPPRDFAAVELASSVTRLAAATGGRTFVLDEALDTRLGAVRDDARALYSLGFATGPEAGSRNHRIEVRVRRDGVELRHRESYRRRTAGERQEEALMAAATLGEVSDSAGLVLDLGEAVPLARRDDRSVVQLAIRIPLASVALVPDDGHRRGSLRVRVAVSDSRGAVISNDDAPVEIAIPEADIDSALAGVWVHRVELRLLPGLHRVAVVVADGGGDLATAAVPLEIPRPAP
ncbi:MAG: VWA domain-containing protein [Thermoanaerobaculia bacterium]|nr:MAG: VWA domain-containing protein [Thermoanaerobaculia bacterium]MBZ0101721.1 VWA domain-containing protein [Thermoanaerobaculia bacterium]